MRHFFLVVRVPGEVNNLLVPVALSASHVAFNSIRLEPTWMVLGQSAGVAAAMVVAAGGGAEHAGVRGVDITRLRDRLRALGQLLEPLPAPTPPSPSPPPGPFHGWGCNHTAGTCALAKHACPLGPNNCYELVSECEHACHT